MSGFDPEDPETKELLSTPRREHRTTVTFTVYFDEVMKSRAVPASVGVFPRVLTVRERDEAGRRMQQAANDALKTYYLELFDHMPGVE